MNCTLYCSLSRNFIIIPSKWLSESGARGFVKHWHCFHSQPNPKSNSPVSASWDEQPLQVDCGYCCHPSVSNLSPLPPSPPPSWSVKRWHLKGGGWILWGRLGIDNDTLINRIQSPLQQLLKRWSIRSRWRGGSHTARVRVSPGQEMVKGASTMYEWSPSLPPLLHRSKERIFNEYHQSFSFTFSEYIQIINAGHPAFST